jgi:hypothetical protein
MLPVSEPGTFRGYICQGDDIQKNLQHNMCQITSITTTEVHSLGMGHVENTMLPSNSPTVPQLLHVHSLLRSIVYRVSAYEWPSLLTPLFWISALMSTPINDNDTEVTWILVPTFQRIKSVSMFRAKDANSIFL